MLSCSIQSKEIEVVYEIKKMNDWNFDVSLSILNSTNLDFDSVWSLHWNQQSSIVNNESIPENLKYEYVAGQSYNILSFGKDYDLKSNDYGYCASCGIEIGIRRLEARPTATRCIDCKTIEEIHERQQFG